MDSAGILESLQSSSTNHRGLYERFSSFLLPFADFIPIDSHQPSSRTKKKPAAAAASTKTRKKTKKPAAEAQTLRPLAKQFLPFLCRALQLLPSLLCKNPESRPAGDDGKEWVEELLAVYRLSLDCLACIGPCLAGKSYSVHLERCRLVCCLEVLGMYGDGENEAWALLESLRSILIGADLMPKAKKGKNAATGCFLPDPKVVNSEDPGVTTLVLEILKSLTGCLYKNKSRNEVAYERILTLVDEVQPWFGFLDTEAHQKYHISFANSLCRCSFFLLQEFASFKEDLVGRFCQRMFSECLNTPSLEKLPNITQKICASIETQWTGGTSLKINLLRLTISSLVCSCKVDLLGAINEYLEAVYHFCCSIFNSEREMCRIASEVLFEQGDDLFQVSSPVASILTLYAIGLFFKSENIDVEESLNNSQSTNDVFLSMTIFDSEKIVHKMTTALNLLGKHFYKGDRLKGPIWSISHEVSVSMESKRFSTCIEKHGKVSLISYLDSLKFLCKLLIEYVNVAWEYFSSKLKPLSSLADLSNVGEVFFEFCNLTISASSLQLCQCTTITEKDKAKLHESQDILLQVIASALKVSLATGSDQMSSTMICCIISSTWIEARGLKYLIPAFYNIGASFYNNGHVEKASTALELCCEAMWAHIKLVTRLHSDRLKGIQIDEPASKGIKDDISYAFKMAAALVELLHKCDAKNLDNVVTKSLHEFTVAEDIFQEIDGSLALVKQWVKITIKDLVNVDAVDDSPVLYNLLEDCSTWSKGRLSKILKEELVAYGLLEARNPNICQTLQLKVINILLNDIYITEDFYLDRSKVLLRKGRIIRAQGIENLNECLNCLSEAISLLRDMPHGSARTTASVYHELALVHCLYALSAQEANKDSKIVLQNVNSALNLWSKVDFQAFGCGTGELGKESNVPLLCSVLDLVSLKGCPKLQSELCKLIITFCTQEGVPLEKCFSMLLNYGRLNHSLCFSPINRDLILNISEQLGFAVNSKRFWINNLEGHQPSLCLFLQKLLLGDCILADDDVQSSVAPFCAKSTVEEIRSVASSLLNARSSSQSAFIVGYLYHDLSQRLMTEGRIFEALSYAREALCLRKKILRRKFICLTEQQYDKSQPGDAAQSIRGHVCLKAVGSVISEVWPSANRSGNVEELSLSPWSALRCYLESTLQVAVLHQFAGNGAEAEVLLRTGKDISCSLGFPVIAVAFSLALGKLYCSKFLFDLVEDELSNAKELLLQNDSIISCQHCKLAFMVRIEMQKGDLSRAISDNSIQVRSMRSSSDALSLYRAALEKLVPSEMEDTCASRSKANPVHYNGQIVKARDRLPQIAKVAKEAEPPACKVCAALKFITSLDSNIEIEKFAENTETVKRSRKPSRKFTKDLDCNNQSKRGKTRYNRRIDSTGEMKGDVGINSDADHELCSDDLLQGDSVKEINWTSEAGDSDKLLLDRDRCWRCLLIQVMKAGSLRDIISLKWERHRRQIALKLLLKIAKCLRTCGGKQRDHEMHEIFGQCILLLFSGNSPRNYSSAPDLCLIELLVDEGIGNIFPIERAAILYNMSCFSSSNIFSDDPRTKCCSLYKIQMPTVVPWLLRAFILCKELPLLFQKVSELLSCIFTLSTVDDSISLPLPFENSLPLNYWAAYFHQASIGTSLNCQYLFKLSDSLFKTGASEDLPAATVEEEAVQASKFFRFAPEKLEDLEKHVMSFFQKVPIVSIICLSMLGGDYANLIGEMLLLPSFFPAWILLSRFNSGSQPIVMLLPVDLIQEDIQHEDHSSGNDAEPECTKQWRCPWGYTVVDYVLPSFKLLLEENFLSLSNSTFTQDGKSWWSKRTMLDKRLDELLKRMEDSWLGPWGCLLSGESRFRNQRIIVQKINKILKCQSKSELNDYLIKTILYGAKSLADAEECIHQLLTYRGYLGRGGCCGEERFRVFSATSQTRTCEMSQMLRDFVQDVVGEHVQTVEREPVILVLDTTVQMLPWESLPVLRNQEVYRMPSVGTIFYTLHKYSRHKKTNAALDSLYPAVDPFRTYYLLNPSGDLNETQAEFEEWFRNQRWEGKAGKMSTTEQLIFALQNYDLFVYFGHGSGTQYISVNEIEKLGDSAAALLMGCSSGSLDQRGPFAPQGAPLSYLFAGSPAVIANLWDVSDKDINRFSKTIVNSWLQDESYVFDNCSKCSQFLNQLGGLTIDGDSAPISKVSRKRNSKEKNQQLSQDDCKCVGRKRITSRMRQAQESCRLKLLIGASPVCYGVPTFLIKKA